MESLKQRLKEPCTEDSHEFSKQRIPGCLQAPNPNPLYSTYTTTSGHTFEIQCFKGYFGGDIGAANTQSFEECLEVCGTTSGCVDVSYVNGNCYMKICGRIWITLIEEEDFTDIWCLEHPEPCTRC